MSNQALCPTWVPAIWLYTCPGAGLSRDECHPLDLKLAPKAWSECSAKSPPSERRNRLPFPRSSASGCALGGSPAGQLAAASTQRRTCGWLRLLTRRKWSLSQSSICHSHICARGSSPHGEAAWAQDGCEEVALGRSCSLREGTAQRGDGASGGPGTLRQPVPREGTAHPGPRPAESRKGPADTPAQAPSHTGLGSSRAAHRPGAKGADSPLLSQAPPGHFSNSVDTGDTQGNRLGSGLTVGEGSHLETNMST